MMHMGVIVYYCEIQYVTPGQNNHKPKVVIPAEASASITCNESLSKQPANEG